MLKLVARVSDTLASKVLGSVDAGACYPRDYCYCLNHRKYYTNCVGTCVDSGIYCSS
jgi:hypothetical protein